VDLIVRDGDRVERVRVRRRGDELEVSVGEEGGRTYRVDAARARDLLHSLRIEGAQHEVAIHRQAPDRFWISGLHGAGPVQVSDPLTHLATESRQGKGSRRRAQVTAYMPGRVVTLLVEEGQEVVAGQGILVLEAMKMENEIQAEQDGVLSKIHVQAGQAVDTGAALFELE
jgi:glutaconyl-CoA/methylmalonyl-CoA decarboxylase subunit gamma